MMAGNPNWWSMHPQQSHELSSQFVFSSASPLSDHQTNLQQDFPVRSWSQLLLGGLSGGEEDQRFGGTLFQQQKKLEINWEQHQHQHQHQHQLLNLNPSSIPLLDHVKQEISHQLYNTQVDQDDQFQANNNININMPNNSNCWPSSSSSHIPVSSPTSCITTLSNNILNFSGAKPAAHHRRNQQHNQDHSSECNSTSSGGVSKKARVQQSSAQPALKVRKEKLGDRITALHQIVSPFGKTDSASVLSEAIGYIRFLQAQIEVLSSPYMRNGSSGNQQHSVQERNCLFPEEACQFLNDIGVEGRVASKQESSSSQQGRAAGVKDLRSRGLCLVPISLTQHVGNENGGDYWAPAALGSGF